MKNNIEVEARCLITEQKYNQLVKYFNKNAKLLEKFHDETAYIDGKENMRLRRDEKHSYIILKSGKIHDEFREEIEIKADKKDFEKLEKLFCQINHPVSVYWDRNRRVYLWSGFKTFLDKSKGYGCMIELEKICNSKTQNNAYNKMLKLLDLIDLKPTNKLELNKKFNFYLKNWKKLLKRS